MQLAPEDTPAVALIPCVQDSYSSDKILWRCRAVSEVAAGEVVGRRVSWGRAVAPIALINPNQNTKPRQTTKKARCS